MDDKLYKAEEMYRLVFRAGMVPILARQVPERGQRRRQEENRQTLSLALNLRGTAVMTVLLHRELAMRSQSRRVFGHG